MHLHAIALFALTGVDIEERSREPASEPSLDQRPAVDGCTGDTGGHLPAEEAWFRARETAEAAFERGEFSVAARCFVGAYGLLNDETRSSDGTGGELVVAAAAAYEAWYFEELREPSTGSDVSAKVPIPLREAQVLLDRHILLLDTPGKGLDLDVDRERYVSLRKRFTWLERAEHAARQPPVPPLATPLSSRSQPHDKVGLGLLLGGTGSIVVAVGFVAYGASRITVAGNLRDDVRVPANCDPRPSFCDDIDDWHQKEIVGSSAIIGAGVVLASIGTGLIAGAVRRAKQHHRRLVAPMVGLPAGLGMELRGRF